MKLTIERARLLSSLGHVQSVVERRTTIPILSNLLMNAADGALSLTATDMEIEIVEKVACDVARPGAITAPAHTLHDIVRKLPDGVQIELDAKPDSGQLVLRAGRSEFKLGCLPVEDFPHMSGGSLAHNFTLAAGELKTLVDRTRFAISTEETRYYLNGIYLHATGANDVPVLRAVATDGHRLARVEMPLPDGAADLPGVIVPRKTVAEVRKLVDEGADSIQVSLSDTKIRFGIGDVILTSKLIDGTFPDYERVIPTGNDKVLDVDAKSFAQAVDRVSTISTEKSRAVKMALGRNVMVLSANAPDAGSATEELEVAYDNDDMEIGFNARYLLDITQQIEGEGARFAMADSASPTIIQDAADASALYVLMPMRV